MTYSETRRLISINQAAKLGYARLRKPVWASPLDHIKIDIIDGQIGPWIHLFAPFNKECNGRDPVDILQVTQQATFDFDNPEFEVYNGALPESDEYRAAVAKFDGVMKGG